MAYPKKFLGGGECQILPNSSGFAVRIVLQFCTMKGAKRDMGIILMVFRKEILFKAIWLFWNKNRIVPS